MASVKSTYITVIECPICEEAKIEIMLVSHWIITIEDCIEMPICEKCMKEQELWKKRINGDTISIGSNPYKILKIKRVIVKY